MKEFYEKYALYIDSFISILAVFVLMTLVTALFVVPGHTPSTQVITWADSLRVLLSYVSFYVSITVLRENYKKYFSSTKETI